MENSVKVGDHFSYDFGDEKFSFPVETVVKYIDGETAILKVTGSVCRMRRPNTKI